MQQKPANLMVILSMTTWVRLIVLTHTKQKHYTNVKLGHVTSLLNSQSVAGNRPWAIFTLSDCGNEGSIACELFQVFSVWCLHQAISDAAFVWYKIGLLPILERHKGIVFAFVFVIARCKLTFNSVDLAIWIRNTPQLHQLRLIIRLHPYIQAAYHTVELN